MKYQNLTKKNKLTPRQTNNLSFCHISKQRQKDLWREWNTDYYHYCEMSNRIETKNKTKNKKQKQNKT